jgi:hypothetical protein
LHQLGSATNLVEFTDSAKTIFWRDHPAVTAPFNTIEVQNASSIINLTDIAMKALGTKSPGRWVTTDDATVILTRCSFTDMGTFGFGTNTIADTCQFNGCDQITHAGSTMNDSTVAGYEGTADSSSLIYDIAVDPTGEMDDMTFTMGATETHAIEFGLTSPLTMTLHNVTFNDYDTILDNQNDSTLHIKRTSGTVTINITGANGTAAADITYRTDGATVVLAQNVSLTFDGMKDNSEVRVYAAGTKTELAGIENATDGSTDNRSFTAAIAAATSVDYVIHNLLYEYIRVEGFSWPSVTQTLGIQQRFDRNYSNPA